MKEENQIIAEFMGIPKCDRCEPSEYCDRYKFGAGIFCLPEEMQYHSSWDWLMPVIEKISRHKFKDGDTAYPRTFGMISSQGRPMFRFNRYAAFDRQTLIEAAYKAVVEFINSTNPQQ